MININNDPKIDGSDNSDKYHYLLKWVIKCLSLGETLNKCQR